MVRRLPNRFISECSGHFRSLCVVYCFVNALALVIKIQKYAFTDSLGNSNYGPVSNLCFISKVVEKVTLDQFNNHCQEYNLVPEYQSAYRKKHSCETSLVKLVNDILWNMENQLVTAIVILDLSETFDRVDHDLLLDVLGKRFGIVGSARTWYEYLKPRRFRVAVEDKISQPRQLDYSVPQGSVQ